nr:MAG TPA: Polo-like Kinase 4 Polo Box 1 [Caudoviricetes sp.]
MFISSDGVRIFFYRVCIGEILVNVRAIGEVVVNS